MKNKNKQSTGNLHVNNTINNNNFQTIKNPSKNTIQIKPHISAKQPIKKTQKENVVASMEISSMIKKKIKDENEH